MMEVKTAAQEGDLLEPLLRLRRQFGRIPHGTQPPSQGFGEETVTAVEFTSTEKKEKPLPRLNVHSAFWIVASIAVTYYVEFFKAVKEMIQMESGWLMLGGWLLLGSLSVAFYCIIYLEWYRGIEDYDTAYPALIPITTASFLAAAICFNVALWSVWSFLTPLVLFTQFMGVVMFISLLG
ncbi:PREDICTED: transmembrane protein 128 [Gekko japonicus]|uniref:Transmembrane protein 128 n=1 Tax=Gekko japonicus TaxID=146911 RepID=A0ABM1KUC4_GEKJA|nr:PREDICTED: transmembrane protein 128 [Gekko japonicus]